MPTDLTGIQVTALHGLLQNQGMSAPDIEELHAQYQTLSAVKPFYDTVVNNILATEKIGEFVGVLTGWDSATEYNAGNQVVYLDKAYEAITTTTINENPTSTVGKTQWIEKTDDSFRTYTIDYTALSSLGAGNFFSWARSSMLQLTGVAGLTGSFINGFTQILTNKVIPTTVTVDINLNNRKVFYTISEACPVLIGSIPQQFANHWGDGILINRSYARTQLLFPAGQSCQTFSNVLSQAQGYAQTTRSVMSSAARSTFGSSNNPAIGATGGLSALAGNSDQGLKQIGLALKRSGNLINLQRPSTSFSAIGILGYVLEKGKDYIGNLHAKVFNRSFVNPETQSSEIIDTAFIQKFYSGSENLVLAETVTDKALAQFMNRVLDSSDVMAIKQFLQADVAVNNFLELINISFIWSDAQALVLETTKKNSVIEAISEILKMHVRVGSSSTAIELGQSMIDMQSIPGKELNELTQPTSQPQMTALLGILGTGSGVNGSMRCEDCLGAVYYNDVLSKAISILTKFYSGDTPNATLQQIIDAMTAIQEASVTPDFNAITKAQWTGYTSWAKLLIDVKDVVDPLAKSLKDQIVLNGMSSLLTSYNRLAETHNTSTFLHTSVPFYTQSGGVSSVINFVQSLPNFGKNVDGFDAQETIELCSIATTQTGQAVIGSIREGKNQQALEKANVTTDANSFNHLTVPVPESGVGLIGGGAWPAPTDPYAN